MSHKGHREEGEGRKAEREAEAARKPCGLNKSLKPADPKDLTVETQGQEELKTHGDQQLCSQGGEGVKEDKTPL